MFVGFSKLVKITVLVGILRPTANVSVTNKTLISPLANKISTILFVIIVAGALASEWNAFIENLNVLGPAIIVLILSMLFIGFYSPKLFGINRKKSITIAIESGIQNGTVGITI